MSLQDILNMDEEQEEAAIVAARDNLVILSGGMDGDGNWLLSLDEGTVFLSQRKVEDYLLDILYIKYKGNRAVRLQDLQRSETFWVNSLAFSQKNKLFEILPQAVEREEE